MGEREKIECVRERERETKSLIAIIALIIVITLWQQVQSLLES